MPITPASCILCGDPIGSRLQTAESRAEFRAIYTWNDNWDSACLSGIGERRQFADLIPSDPSCNVTAEETRHSEQLQLLDIWLMKIHFGNKFIPVPRADYSATESEHAWGFPLHPSCWVIWSSLQPKSKEHIQAIFDLCRSFPIQVRGIMSFGHDYGGSLKYLDGVFNGEEAQLVHREGTEDETVTSNICSILKLHPLFESDYNIHEEDHGGTVSLAQEIETRAIWNSACSTDPFKRLPVEVLTLILIELGSMDAVNLKQVSRIYANLVLPDVFWRSRFLPGRVFEYLFPEAMQYSSRASGRWKSIFLGVRELRNIPEMKNRERIWKLACSMEDLLALIGKVLCSGLPSSSYFEPNAAQDTFCWTIASRALKSHRELFTAGSRVLRERNLSQISESQTIFISTIEVFGLSYISGIRFDLGGECSSSIGYIHPQHETAVSWEVNGPRASSIAGFHLAQDLRGIRGIAVLSDIGTLSGWIGEHDGIPKRRLVLGRCNDRIGGLVKMLKGGFDSHKLVSLGISAGDKMETDLKSDPEHEISFRDTAIWSHEIPDARLNFLGQQVSQRTFGCPQIALDIGLFGGLEGQNLRHIEKLTVWIMEPEQFLGIEVSFDRLIDGQTKLLLAGDRIKDIEQANPTATQIDFSIDSHSGERITGMDVYSLLNFRGWDGGFLGFSVHTNYGRTGEFPPSSKEGYSDQEVLTRSLCPDSGTIVGFSIAWRNGNTIEDLGTVHIELPERELETLHDRN